jgi:hypothetical protein
MAAVASLLVAGVLHAAPACKGTLYLTLDTSSMSQAENIARILAKHDVKATFFLANEKTVRGDYSLDPSWGDYWRARVAEGHVFGSHTWDHGYFRVDVEGGRLRYVREGKASRRQVGVGVRIPGFTEVTSGVDAGDTVVIGGQERLQDGMPVQGKPAEREPAPKPTEGAAPPPAGGP